MLPQLIEDVVCLTVDEYFPPPTGTERRIPEGFELLYSETALQAGAAAAPSV